MHALFFIKWHIKDEHPFLHLMKLEGACGKKSGVPSTPPIQSRLFTPFKICAFAFLPFIGGLRS
jgi:hypothetical protein